ncbi:MAG: AAA family ATPase [Candidatus Njordarchaeales archaeon]
MKLVRLRIENIATYEKAEIVFDNIEYPLFVTGKTGAGKTTLFVDALTAALFGGAYGAKTGYRNLVMEGKNRGLVELEFEIGDTIYFVRRVFFRDKSPSAILYVRDKSSGNSLRIMAQSARIVDERIRKLTGLDYEVLLNSVIVRQGDVYEFLRKRPSERRDLLVDILRIRMDNLRDLVKKKTDNLEKEKAKLEKEKEILEREVSKKEEIQKEIENIEKELPVLSKKESGLRRVEEELEAQKRDLDNRLGEIKSQLDKMLESEKNLKTLREKLQNIEEEISRIKEAINRFGVEKLQSVNEYMKYVRELNSLKMRIKELQMQKEKYENLLKMKKEIENLKKELMELGNVEEKENELLVMRDNLSKERGVIEGKIQTVKDVLKKLDEAEAYCPVCGSLLPPNKKVERKKHLKNELSGLENKLRDVLKELKRIETEATLIREKVKRKRDLQSRLIVLRRNIEKEDVSEVSEENFQRICFELEELERKYDEKLKLLQEFSGEEELEKIEEVLQQMLDASYKLDSLRDKEALRDHLLGQIRSLEAALEDKKKLILEQERLEKERESIENKIATIRKELENTIGRRNRLEEKLKTLREELEKILKKEKRLDQVKNEIAKLLLDIQAYKVLDEKVFAPGALPTRLLKDYVELLQEYTNDYLRIFGQPIEVEFIFSQRGSSQSIDMNIYSNGFKREIRTFSGGEQTLIGFAIRLAIGKLLAQLYSRKHRPRFLIIDEGFGPLDEELRLEVAEALSRLQTSGEYDQIIVISHHQELRNNPAFKTILEVVKDNRNISQLRKVT